MKTDDLATRLIEALRDDTVLFAGAGCSAKVGIPVWADYLKHLALTAERYEPEVAALMRKRIDSEKFLAAAFLFKHELQAPEGDKWAAICAPFGAGTYSHEPLLPLVSLSFRAIVTTNFDSSLFDAWGDIATQRKIPRPQLLAREHTRGIAYISNFCLFLHGRASLPIQAENIVLDTKDYEQCYNDQAFTDGPLQLLSARTCLFVGFSFREPGITAILATWTRLKGPTAFPRKHAAVLPSSAHTLAAELVSMNVEVLTYDDSIPGHEELWKAIRSAAQAMSSRSRPEVSLSSPVQFQSPFGPIRDLLAMSYARASLETKIDLSVT